MKDLKYRKRLYFLLLAVLLWPSIVLSASKQFVAPGTAISFQDSGGTVVLAWNGVAAGAGSSSARYDKGAGSIPAQYWWSCSVTLTGTNVPGAMVEIYVSLSDGVHADGALGTTAAALASADKRRDLKLVGTVIVDQAASNVTMTASGMAWIPTRYFSVAFWNATTLPLQAVANTSSCTFVPSPFEMQ